MVSVLAGASSRGRRWLPLAVAVAGGAVLLLCATEARADDMWVSSGFGIFAAAFALVALIPLFGLYILAMVALECWVFKAMLELTTRESFGYSLLANASSALVSLVWYMAGAFEGGWKTAMLKGEHGRAVLLMIKSYAVTLCVETAMLLLALSKQRDTKLILKATAAANGVSYVVWGT